MTVSVNCRRPERKDPLRLPGDWFGVVVIACTGALGAISLWIAFALPINPAAGRVVFAFPGPAYRPRARS